jgi:hypothetical protein
MGLLTETTDNCGRVAKAASSNGVRSPLLSPIRMTASLFFAIEKYTGVGSAVTQIG